jgi:pilus assembly protein CpaF
LIAEAIDVLVQIGIRHEVRRVTVISNVAKDLRNGNIGFEPVYRYDELSPKGQPRWEKLGSLGRRVLAETNL